MNKLLLGPAKFLGSFGLSVFILAALFVLTFVGTWEQQFTGLHETTKRFFESWVVVGRVGWLRIPLLGGHLLMGMLAVNLLFGGLVRIRKTWRTAGIIVAHVGISLLLVAGFVKTAMADEGRLTLIEGKQSDDFQSYYRWEVAIHDALDDAHLTEHLIPEAHFVDLKGDTGGKRSRKFHSNELPFELTMRHFVVNADVRRGHAHGGASQAGRLPVVDGYQVVELPRETEAEFNSAALYVTARDVQTGAETPGILWGLERHPMLFEAGGKRWAMTLRHKRYRMPFSIRLDEIEKVDHARTTMAKEFQSDVTKFQGDDERQIHISMNKPLRTQGYVLFQSGWGPQDGSEVIQSTFSVVRNPSDRLPEVAMWITVAGLLFAFVMKFVGWSRKQSQRPQTGAKTSEVLQS
jgi:hypothetical protein